MRKFSRVLGLGAIVFSALAVGILSVQAKDTKSWAPRSSYVRILHAIPNGPKVDVFVDSTKILNDVVFDSSISKYIRIPAGYHRIRIVSNNPSRVLYSASTRQRIDRFYTVAVIGSVLAPKVHLIDETRGTTNPRRARVSVTHFAYGAPAVDIVARTVTGHYYTIVSNLRYGQTRQLWLTPGKYDLFVRANGHVIKEINDAQPQGGRRYAAYAIGQAGGSGINAFNLLFDVAASQ